MLSLRHLSKSYGGLSRRVVLENINLELSAGQYIAIMGESGVGKSTLLNLIAGLDTPDGGYIVIDGVDTSTLNDAQRTLLRRKSMGFAFQAFHLLPHLTVAQNLALPLALNSILVRDRARRVAEMLEVIHLADRATAYPRELSGGQMQRVAVARALIHSPRLVLADEPTGNLDQDSAAQVLSLLARQVSAQACAAILVTHSPVAAASADKIYVLDGTGLHER